MGHDFSLRFASDKTSLQANDHLPDLEFNLKAYMKQIEKRYISKKKSGKDKRGNMLPIEKPILKIAYEEIGQYKDRFILPDRVSLFLYRLWNKMGDKKYDDFLKELFQYSEISYDKFEKLTLKYLPRFKNELFLWLNTNDYPLSFRISIEN